jgi:hypothetical protein
MIKDPLQVNSSHAQKELFDRFGSAANQFTTNDVVGAAANILINALRQTHKDRQSAEVGFDELFGRMKTILVNHYDMNGRRRGLFPYDQTIGIPFSDFRHKH